MPGEIKRLSFSDGVTVTAPNTAFLQTGKFVEYANTAAYVAAKGSAAADSDTFYNTTTDTIFLYQNGSWQELPTTSQASLTEYGYLSGVTSSIQTQIDSKITEVMTTRGDVLYRNSSNVTARLGIGSTGQVIGTNDGVDLGWVNVGGGDVTAASNIADNTIVRGDGGAKGVQEATNVFIDDSDRLSIGNNSASSFNSAVNQLVVGDGTTDQGLAIYTSNTTSGRVSFVDTASTAIQGSIEYKHSSNTMCFRSNDTEIMRATSSSVGINNTNMSSFNSATNQLVVGDGTDDQGIIIYTDNAGVGRYSFVDTASTAIQARIEYNHSTNTMKLVANDTSNLEITSSSVGINNNNMSSFNAAANQLVVGDGTTDQGITIYSSSSTSGRVCFVDAASGTIQGQVQYDHNNTRMAFNTEDSNRMMVSSDGLSVDGLTPASHGIKWRIVTDSDIDITTTGTKTYTVPSATTVLGAVGRFKASASSTSHNVLGYFDSTDGGTNKGNVYFNVSSGTDADKIKVQVDSAITSGDLWIVVYYI